MHCHDAAAPSTAGRPRKTASIGNRMKNMWMFEVPVSQSPLPGRRATACPSGRGSAPRMNRRPRPRRRARCRGSGCGRSPPRDPPESRSSGPVKRLCSNAACRSPPVTTPPPEPGPPRFLMIRMIAGPRMTTNSDGKMQPTSGNSILIGALAAISSARWRRSMRSCSDWTWSTLLIETPSCSAWMIAPMKLVSGDDLGPRDDVAQRVAACLAHPDLGERAPELVGERADHLLDHLAERGVEAEPGPDADRQEVERIRDLEEDRLLAGRARAGPARTPGRCSRTRFRSRPRAPRARSRCRAGT